ncbi:MAG TPA: hybrid sensor histidine kinase/response regulator [Humidesulfovibrio sp.]|uniref:hybrid sensor histidine kinase/response regulator n=1 Tax=Humidesulfovibrio sp. TaxID=2910988 RepID=UPI002C7DEBC2|nr:hybrid sensor histidine kinase/response regulator [Humidesulfovibrio sp.]HWR04101.1 hybrid sensor histidine kinase/response regulator [Humidesulfovibrio sp.]
MTLPPSAARASLLQDMSVLFVDDDALVSLQVQGYLAGEVRALHLAQGGQEGMFSYALHRPDVVITDVDMPGMSGLELAQAVRGINPEVPLVLLTRLDDAGTLRHAVTLGVTGYLTKPLDPEVLKETLARAAQTLHLKRELSRQQRLNELMLDAAPSPSVLVDLLPGRIAAGNQLAAALGYAAGGTCGGPLIPESLLDELRRGGEELMAASSSREVAAHGRHWVLHWAPVGFGSILFTAVDITRRVEMEHFRDDVERIARHDLKTPLSAFTAIPELLLLDDNLTGQQREFIEVIRDAGMRMLGMINLSLDLYKMETGVYELPAARFDLNALTRQTVRQAEALSRTMRTELSLQAPEEALWVRGDELLCQSMLGNLLKNALEASPPGGAVRVGVTAGPLIQVRIANAGEVPADMRERFFGKYATSGKSGGTGLGTYSARMVARAHGGEVHLDMRTPGETTLCVQLPATG